MDLSPRQTTPPVEGLVELWRAPVRGNVANQVHCDAVTGSVWVGDGAQVSFASMSVQRLDLATGAQTASVRTRHQHPRATAAEAGALWVATDRRLFRLDPVTLAIEGQWEDRLVRYADRLLPSDGRIVMANVRAPAIGVFDPATGTTRRLTVGARPVLAALPDGVAVARRVDDGQLRRLEVDKVRLVDPRPAPPVASMAWLDGLWAVPADRHGDGTASVVRLDGPGRHLLAGRVSGLVPDLSTGVLWAILDDGRIQAVDVLTGTAGPVYTLPATARVKHVAPDAGVVAVTMPTEAADDLVALYRLPVPS